MAAISNSETNRLSYYVAWAMTLSFAVDYRFKIGLDFELSEILLIGLVGATLTSRGVSSYKSWQLLVFIVWTCVFALSLSVSDRPDKTITAFRNISFGMLMLFTILANSFSDKQTLRLFKVFVWGGVITSLLGVHQAIYGYDHSLILIDYDAIREQAKQSGGTDVFSWKLNNINSGSLSVGQSALSLGLYTFSNNFGEFLVYVTIALCGLRRSISISKVAFGLVLVLILTAMFLSQSRSSLIGTAIVLAYYLLKSFKGVGARSAFVVLMLLLLAGLVPYAISSLGYDGFKTVQGRGQLDAGSIVAFTESLVTLLMGGNLKSYYETFAQDPHNTFLYLCMIFGIPFAMVFLCILIGVLSSLYLKSRAVLNVASRSVVESGFAVAVWFIGYGMTWSVVNVALSDLMWAFFVGCAFSMRLRQDPLDEVVADQPQMLPKPAVAL